MQTTTREAALAAARRADRAADTLRRWGQLFTALFGLGIAAVVTAAFLDPAQTGPIAVVTALLALAAILLLGASVGRTLAAWRLEGIARRL